MLRNQQHLLLIGMLFFFLMITGLYTFSKFSFKKENIEGLELKMNKSRAETFPFVYLFDGKNSVEFDYAHPNKVKEITDTSLVFEFENSIPIRKIRLYIEKKVDNLVIDNIYFIVHGDRVKVNLSEFKSGNGLEILNHKNGKLEVNVQELNGYLETPNFYYYSNDYIALLAVLGIVLVILLVLFIVFKRLKILQEIKLIKLSELSVVVFVCSIFLPHPVFNVTLILSLLMVVKKFNLQQFLSEKINLIFIGCFIILFLNNLFIAEGGYLNLKPTETYLPLFILPIYISCVRTSNGLAYFPISAIVMGLLMFLTSVVDAAMFKNVSYFSFDEFAKYTHPVYYSYLASFSIFYIFLYSKLDKRYKDLIQGLLFFFIILAGSKLVITLTFIIYAGLVIRNIKAASIVLLGLVVLALFPPVQKRFNEILNVNDLSVVNEQVITDNNDPRINGLTLRLLLWQESINVVTTVPEIVFGKGVGKATDDVLKSNLIKRGLGKYQRFSTHNQFINIFMRAGLVGVFSLLMIIIFGFYQAIKKKNKMLLIMVIMFTFAMLTESVFQRVLGIYFFTTILLFLMKPSFLNKIDSLKE
jgi:O-antigen ligase